jgi:hypothetical protein
MPKKQPRTQGSLKDHVKLTSVVPFSLEGLPAEAWKCFCVVAWKRLEQNNPRWADLIREEFWNFRTTWRSRAHLRRYKQIGGSVTGNVDDSWMLDVFQFMLNTSLKKGQKPLANPRAILADYERLVRAVTVIKKENPGISKKPLDDRESFWRKQLQGILDQQPYRDKTGTHATVTEDMISIASSKSTPPSEIALEILRHLDGLSPSTLKKKTFPKLKKAELSPLELWRNKI